MLLVMEGQQWLLINGNKTQERGLMHLELTMPKLTICLGLFITALELTLLEEMLLLEPVLQYF